MAHHPPSEGVRLRHQRLHLGQPERGVQRAVAGARAGTACRRGLDDVRARAHHRAHHVANPVRPVAHAQGQQGVVDGAAGVPRRAHPIADPARGRDDLDAQHQPRARDQVLLDGDLEAGIEPAAVADRRVAHGQGLREDPGRAQVRGAGRLVEAQARGQAVAVGGHVVVGVNEPGNERAAADVDDLGVDRPLEGRPGAGGRDALAVDHHGGIRHRCGTGAVDQRRAGQDEHLPLSLHRPRAGWRGAENRDRPPASSAAWP